MKNRLFSALSALLAKYSQLRYLISGGVSFILELGSFVLLFRFTGALFIANTISFLIGLGASFALHKWWSFAHDHALKTKHQFALYSCLAIINLSLSNLGVNLFVNHLHITAYLAKPLIIIVVALWNYVLLNKVIFSHKN